MGSLKSASRKSGTGWIAACAAPGFQNDYTPKRFGSNAHTNDFLIRPTTPFAPNGITFGH